MKRLVLLGFVLILSASTAFAQAPSAQPDTPFKLATFEAGGTVRVGLVVGETVLAVQEANRALTSAEGLSSVEIPNEMRLLIESYDRTKSRLYQIANYYSATGAGDESFAYAYDDVALKAPIKYPYNMLAAAANYQDHSAEMMRRYGNPNPQPVDPDRSNPVFFAKSPRSSIIDPGAAFPVPPVEGKGFDWENELAVIIGKPATRLTLDNAADHVFGYSIVFDVSTRDRGEQDEDEDRGGGGGFSFGVNWFEAKSRDNAAPFGPVIVPKEFIGDSANLRMTTKINGVLKQDGNTKDMIHNEGRLLRHVTSILTLYPGDVLVTGTPAGVGSARNPPEFLEVGDVVEMWIEGIGTLVTPIE
ncbi:MAG: fumarylacetoacetate hydrolase family protein [Vicinamibacterales bacterium]|jgi:2-keto-4-pentenoate hydratase/2-oxohepta-3-ene-1,7-dioic acid hydratase in catechol pathway|nr:hypothetical protein [Acidobacteriota bacterium]MDP7338140.1 fumarylacetoacetate hydrolase family protein [Vicinamibacterales bacterium]MDP7472560.1 fumarylacetoacetate hydrolase family protein [Vicinamibacterales bacterium]MDP7671769.1 fumarylacetoacetate hydrolase family protein [Vicinamibacterales bacterium]HJO39794.1 fumarylacetoacetate hydrolase family protein [Vicinamibacterales bacterium]|tara:strand:- start:1827 stop:2903 length:1077 start_codon:yes stop_codon:yes gene_type:complete